MIAVGGSIAGDGGDGGDGGCSGASMTIGCTEGGGGGGGAGARTGGGGAGSNEQPAATKPMAVANASRFKPALAQRRGTP